MHHDAFLKSTFDDDEYDCLVGKVMGAKEGRSMGRRMER